MPAHSKELTLKLSNDKFVSNAPEEVVAKEKQKQDEMSATLQALQIKLEELESL